MRIHIGQNRTTGSAVELPTAAFVRHLHLVGFSGSGKTTALLTLLQDLLRDPIEKRCVVIVDRLGGFSLDLLRWFSSPFCPEHARRRLLYVEPSREDVVMPMNPLLYATAGEGYYRTARATELVLRGWASQDISQMPRLARWLFNSFWAAAQCGLTIGDCVHLLRPNSPLHRPLIGVLPESLRWEWHQILNAHGNQAEVQLESCRNRLTPIFESPALRATFSSTRNYLDVLRWMRERRIVVINLAPNGVLPETIADTIGGMVVNEVFSVARSLPPEQRVETLLCLDEFQRFVNADLEFSLAESRQLKTRLILSHQSFSQLERGDVDLTALIFQAQTRMILSVHGPDATLLAEELAALTFQPDRIKDEIWNRCQRISGHRVVELSSHSQSEQLARQWSESHGESRGQGQSTSRRGTGSETTKSESGQDSTQANRGKGGSESTGSSSGWHQSLVPIYEEFLQLSSRNYVSFEEQKHEWGKRLRELRTGEALLKIVNDARLHELIVRRSAPGHLGLDWDVVRRRMPKVADAYDRMLAENFSQADCFVTPSIIERDTNERLQRILQPRLEISTTTDSDANPNAEGTNESPFSA